MEEVLSLGDVLKYAIGFTVLILDYFSTLCLTEGIWVTYPKAIKMFFCPIEWECYCTSYEKGHYSFVYCYCTILLPYNYLYSQDFI